VIVPSSEQTAMPRAALLRPHLTDVLRFKAGWTINTLVNDTLDFNRGGNKFITIPPGTYATGAAMAAAIVAAMEGTDSTPVWACSYSASKFTISSDLAFTLLFSTGSQKQTSAHLDLGYTTTDKGSATSQVAENVSYQSRHAVNVDALSALASTIAIVLGHNLSAAGTAVLHTTVADLTLVASGFANTSLAVQAVSGGTDLRIEYFATISKRHRRLLLSDVQNSVGYNELGVWFVGEYLDLVGFAVDVRDARDELGEIAYAIEGAQHALRRNTRRVWELRLHNITAAKKVELETFAAYVRVGVPFFFDFDGAGTNVRYVFLDQGIVFESVDSDPVTWSASLRLLEAMG